MIIAPNMSNCFGDQKIVMIINATLIQAVAATTASFAKMYHPHFL